MPRRCVLGCPPNKRGRLHVFPHPEKFPEQYKAWIRIWNKKIDSDFDYKKYRICDRHFSKKYMTRSSRLSAAAVPSLFLPKCSLTDSNAPTENNTMSIGSAPNLASLEHDYCFSYGGASEHKGSKTTFITEPTIKCRIHQKTIQNLRQEVFRLRKEKHALQLRLKNIESYLNEPQVNKLAQMTTKEKKWGKSLKKSNKRQ